MHSFLGLYIFYLFYTDLSEFWGTGSGSLNSFLIVHMYSLLDDDDEVTTLYPNTSNAVKITQGCWR